VENAKVDLFKINSVNSDAFSFIFRSSNLTLLVEQANRKKLKAKQYVYFIFIFLRKDNSVSTLKKIFLK
jgi:hypothetical protein